MPSLEGMINRADELLYQAKREGRNRVILEESA
jgi:PleD family two-component response regulator